jgi:hypothetical protein
MAPTIKLPSGSRIELCPAGGKWFNGKTYFGPDEHGWQVISKHGELLGQGFCANRNDAVREATECDKENPR